MSINETNETISTLSGAIETLNRAGKKQEINTVTDKLLELVKSITVRT